MQKIRQTAPRHELVRWSRMRLPQCSRHTNGLLRASFDVFVTVINPSGGMALVASVATGRAGTGTVSANKRQ